MKELENNLIGKITYQIALLAFLEGVKVSEETNNNSETLEENRVRDITIQKCLDKLIKKHYKEILNVSTQKFQMFQIKNRKKK